MVPDPDLQLSVVIKALRDVVAPAVDPMNALAVEQLHLALATLAMVRTRLPLLHVVARQELANAMALASAVDADGEIGKRVADGRAMLDDPAITTGAIDSGRIRLLDAVSELVATTTDPERRNGMARAVIALSKPQCDLARAWSLPAEFEPDPGEVPAIESLL